MKVNFKDLLNMKECETVYTGPWEVFRVPGGWIFSRHFHGTTIDGQKATSCFVPLTSSLTSLN